MAHYNRQQELLFEGRRVLFHNYSMKHGYSIVNFNVTNEEMKIMRARPDFYSGLGKVAYLRVLTSELSPFSIDTNRAAVFLLTQEE